MSRQKLRRKHKHSQQEANPAVYRSALPPAEHNVDPETTAVLTDRPELPYEEHNYIKAQRWLEKNKAFMVRAGQVNDLRIEHDDWCNVYDGHLCNCRPDLILNSKRLRYPASVLGDTYAPNR